MLKEYVFLRINEKFRNFFACENISSFLELYYRRDESVFYKEQFRLFLEKNKPGEIVSYLKSKLANRDELSVKLNILTLVNTFYNTKEVLELNDNYLVLKGDFNHSVISKYLCEYDSDFLMIDINKSKIERLSLVN